MELSEIFASEAVLERPRLLFLMWHAWQRTPSELPDLERARLVAKALADVVTMSKEQICDLVAHYRVMFEAAAFDDDLLPPDAKSGDILLPPSTCPPTTCICSGQTIG